ncbi:phage gp6-like head-tail connector protein [Streptomyces sp. NPDC002644]
MPIATPEDVAARLGWPLTVDEQTRVTAYIEDCTALVEDYCGRDFVPRTDQDLSLIGDGSCMLTLPRRVLPYLTITDVLVDGVAVEDWDTLRTWSGGMTLYREAGWSGLVKLTGSWGYPTPPAPVRVAVIAEVIRWMAASPGVRMERTGEREVEYESTPSQSLSETAKAALRRYRPSVGTLSLMRGD